MLHVLSSLVDEDRSRRLSDVLAEVDVELVDVPEDCSNEQCWRNGGLGACTCGGDDDDGTTAAPGGW